MRPWTWFTYMPALQVSGENHMGILMEYFTVMNMTKRPILVTLGDEVTDRAWRIVSMFIHAA